MEEKNKVKEKEHKIHVGQGVDMAAEAKKSPEVYSSSNGVLMVIVLASTAVTAAVWYQNFQLGVEFKELLNLLNKTENRQPQEVPQPVTDDLPRDCFDIQMMGEGTSGLYKIYPTGVKGGVDVFCDMDNADGGWLVFQRRLDGSVDFKQDWETYLTGFGNLKGEFWLGNELLHVISTQGWYKLRVDMTDFDGNSKYAEYKIFRVGNLASGYQLVTTGYSGNAGNSMQQHNNMKFSTHDADNDNAKGSCAQSFKGGFWYNNCHYANPNGEYLKGEHEAVAIGVNWYHWRGYNYSLKTLEMKIKPL